ncbi:MAG TPA: universal stress protein [Solirubrobacteraceae bacterium]|nr:universal stress protein [Solirubrobacteraceae bacterium]
MSKIIVGVDESERSQDAAALAARLARGTGAELLLVCAYPYDDHPSRSANAEYRRYLREDALAALERAAGALPDDVPAERLAIPEVSPAKTIQEQAAKARASLIVIGSSHRGALGRVLAGTTAERLLHGAPCPVAVAPRGHRHAEHERIATIAVGCDGSPESEAALTAAVGFARLHGARLRLIEVLDTTWLGTPALMQGPGQYADPQEREAQARSWLAGRVAALPEDVAAEPLVLTGLPEAQLAEQSRHADLVVVGSRGYGPHRSVLLGSVSGWLVRDAACPVLVVPRGIEAPLETLFGAESETQPA